MTELIPDTREAVRFLEGWLGRNLRLLTAINERGVTTAKFTEASYSQMADWIERHQGKANIYFTPNIVEETFAGRKKPRKLNIAGALGLHVDIDPRPGFDVTEEQERILKSLQSYHLPPSVIIFSGGGYQALWRLREPFLTKGDPLNIDLIEAYNRKLAADLGGDNTHNIDRILRVPGTINILDDRKRAKGRVPAVARLVSWN